MLVHKNYIYIVDFDANSHTSVKIIQYNLNAEKSSCNLAILQFHGFQ